jgi:plastocyanin
MKIKSYALVALFLISCTAHAAEVKMKSLSYDPKRIEITQGESITWKNTSLTDHSATSEDSPKSFDTGLVPPGKESRKIVFNKLGVFKYHCSVHGKTMSGIVSVKAAQ